VSEGPVTMDGLQGGTNAIGEAEEAVVEVGETMAVREAVILRTKHTAMRKGGDRILHH
jgi:hypothetical protein